MKKLCIKLAELFGWKYDIPEEGTRPDLRHCVLIAAPHTSVWDFFLGATCLWKLKINFCLFMKKEYFNFLTTPILRRIGVVPVDRGNRKNHMVDKAVETLKNNPDISVVLTPEGTRKATKRWKRGFYEIASDAGVPVCLSYIDYSRKVMGIKKTVVMPSGDFDADMEIIKSEYSAEMAKHPKNFTK